MSEAPAAPEHDPLDEAFEAQYAKQDGEKGQPANPKLSRAARQVWLKKPDRSGQCRWIPDDGSDPGNQLDRWSQKDFGDSDFMVMQISSQTKREYESTDAETQTDPIVVAERVAQTPFDSDVYERLGAQMQETFPKYKTPGQYLIDGKKQVVDTGGRWPISRDCGISCQLMASEDVGTQPDVKELVNVIEADLAPVQIPEEELPAVSNFLRGVAKPMEDALQNNSVTQAFLFLEMSRSDQGDFEAVERHSLEVPAEARSVAVEGDQGEPPCLDVTSVSWNATGNVLAISYGDLRKTGWCNLKSCIGVWHLHKLEAEADADRDGKLSREEMKAAGTSDIPSALLEIPSQTTFVSCIEFHKEEPAILASGMYSGEIMVWDVSAEEEVPLMFTSRISDYAHREPVTALAWVPDQKEKALQLASLGNDGRLLLWTLANKLDSPIIGFSMAMVNPQRLRAEYRANGSITAIPSAKEKLLGGSAFSFFPENRGEVVVGTESGAVLKCSFPTHDEDSKERPPDLPEAQGKVKWTHRAQALVDNVPTEEKGKLRRRLEQDALDQKKDKLTLQFIFYTSKPPVSTLFPCSVNFYYEGCMGPVHGLQYSPFHRHLFLACSTDGSLRIYHKLRRKVLLHIEPPCGSYLYGAAWSPARPMVLAVVAGSGAVYIYDLKHSTARPVVTEQVCKGSELISLSWNNNRPGLIAIGTAQGSAKVLEISENLVTPLPQEIEKLNTFAQSALEDRIV